ncbi:hypothetical protein PO124_11765 [Bacillus licheniformis]|nr:hypothetical protein [Bacillus licheniformis]
MTTMLDSLFKRIGYKPGQQVTFADLPEFYRCWLCSFHLKWRGLRNERISMTKQS